MIAGLVLMLLPSARRESLARGIRGSVLRPVLAMQPGVMERHARFDDPDRLRAQRDSLAAFLVGQSGLMAENRQLRGLLGLGQRLPPSFVPAEIIRTPGRAAEGFFELTAGAEQGVQPGSPIVASEGLVGRVNRADAEISFGIDWMNPDFAASAMTLDGQVYGIVEPRRGPGGEPMLALTGTPRHVELKQGTLIVTSGHGGVYPRGIPIGRVAGMENAQSDWQRNYLVEPAVSPAEMTYVMVLGAPQPGLAGEDLATTWGIRPTPKTAAVDSSALRALEAAAARANAAQQAAEAEANPEPSRPTQRGPHLLGRPVVRDTGGRR